MILNFFDVDRRHSPSSENVANIRQMSGVFEAGFGFGDMFFRVHFNFDPGTGGRPVRGGSMGILVGGFADAVTTSDGEFHFPSLFFDNIGVDSFTRM